MLNGLMCASVSIRLSVAIAASLITAATCGCNASRPTRTNIQSADSAARIRAIKAAADNGDVAAIPLIVDRLEDEDQAVQFFAILALERLTGKRLGYEVGQPSQDRVAAIDRWRNYVEQGGHKLSINKEKATGKGESLSQRNPINATETTDPAPSTGN